MRSFWDTLYSVDYTIPYIITLLPLESKYNTILFAYLNILEIRMLWFSLNNSITMYLRFYLIFFSSPSVNKSQFRIHGSKYCEQGPNPLACSASLLELAIAAVCRCADGLGVKAITQSLPPDLRPSPDGNADRARNLLPCLFRHLTKSFWKKRNNVFLKKRGNTQDRVSQFVFREV